MMPSTRDADRAFLIEKTDTELRLQGVNLQAADLSKLDLRHINFKYANLSGSNLSGANLSWSPLERADLSNTNMEVVLLLKVSASLLLFRAASCWGLR